jgi:hypothetical protein
MNELSAILISLSKLELVKRLDHMHKIIISRISQNESHTIVNVND